MGRITFLEAPIPQDSKINREEILDALEKLGIRAVIDDERLKVQLDGDPKAEIAVRGVIKHLLKLEIDEKATNRVDSEVLDDEVAGKRPILT